MRHNLITTKGFTLLEVLVAMFVFALVGFMLANSLHRVMSLQAGTAMNAERLHKLQMALLVLSQDVEQATMLAGKEKPVFWGAATGMTLTRTGRVVLQGDVPRYKVQRVHYGLNQSVFMRNKTVLLENVASVRFEYLDKQNKFYSHWPIAENPSEILPRAVRVMVAINNWGALSQLYVIATDPTEPAA